MVCIRFHVTLTLLKRTGHVFEKRLIEAYISENGKDPVTNEDLTPDDLVDLKSARIVRPRPPTLTSIPSLLSVFQSEWDALALETYKLRQHLTQTRQELSTALYQHDAAIRVIARLTRERDEARDVLSRITVNGGAVSNGDAMQVDGQELPDALVGKVEATREKYAAEAHFLFRPTGNTWVNRCAIGYSRPDESAPFQMIGPPLKQCNPSLRFRSQKRFIRMLDHSCWTRMAILHYLVVRTDMPVFTQYLKTK